MNRKACLLLVTLAALNPCACGSKKLSVSGHLLDNGNPFHYDRGQDRIDMRFIKVEDGKNTETSFPAEVFEDGRFEVRAADIPPGSYRIALQQVPYLPIEAGRPGMPPGQAADRFSNRFSQAESPIVREILSSTDDLVIDLAKPAP